MVRLLRIGIGRDGFLNEIRYNSPLFSASHAAMDFNEMLINTWNDDHSGEIMALGYDNIVTRVLLSTEKTPTLLR